MAHSRKIDAVADRVMTALITGLEREFGPGADEKLARHFLAAEEDEFFWDVRQAERWLGCFEEDSGDDLELDRVTIYGRIDGQRSAAITLINGDGRPHRLIGRRWFSSKKHTRDRHSQMLNELGFHEEQRRWTGAAAPLFLSCGWATSEKEGVQDKGNASRGSLCLCLHIIFARDSLARRRDCRHENSRILRDSHRYCEIIPRLRPPR